MTGERSITDPTYEVSDLSVDGLVSKLDEPFDWLMQVIAGSGAYIWKSVSRTGLVRLEIQAFSREYREDLMALCVEAGRVLANGGLVDDNIRYADGHIWTGWVLFYPDEEVEK